LHDTPKGGNNLLRFCFDAIHGTPHQRGKVPPFFVFTKGSKGRDVVFRGLAAPGSKIIGPTDDLVAVWKSTGNKRFQNYQAHFTVLNVPVVSRLWIEDLLKGNSLSENCPQLWRRWVETGTYEALLAEPTMIHRRKTEQLPSDERKHAIVEHIYRHFQNDPLGFERCAAEIARLMDNNIVSYDLTRFWRDGGRDAIGFYGIGPLADRIKVDFALEAKCYNFKVGVGVTDTSRLISRLRHRQFGILVTTSYVSEQAYKEIREDGHPVIIVAAEDIARILTDAGIDTSEKVMEWLKSFPKVAPSN